MKIKKHLTPYSFRHSKATQSAHFMTAAQMNAYFGWSQGSKSPKTYIHLSGVDVKKTLLIQAGLLKPEEKETGLSVIQCPRCGTVNPHQQTLCTKCQSVLSLKANLALEEELKRSQKETIKALEQKHLEQYETLGKQYFELKENYEQLREQPEPEWMKEFRESMKEFKQYAKTSNMKKQMRELGQEIGKENTG